MVITEVGGTLTNGAPNGARKRRLKRRRITMPGNFTANETSNTTISLGWQPSEGLYVDGYKILRDGVQIADVPAVFGGSYGDSGLTRNTTYVYVIYAYNRFGGESPTATATETTPDNPGD